MKIVKTFNQKHCSIRRFHLCASRGRLDCLDVILSHGVEINVTDGTGKIRLVLLKEVVIDFNEICPFLSVGFNALHLAAKNGQPDCLKRLLQVGFLNIVP